MQDPFHERLRKTFSRRAGILGGMFEFESGHRDLLNLVDSAYARLTPQRLSRKTPRFKIRMQLTARKRGVRRGEPPPLRTQGGAGLICGLMDAQNFAVVCPETHAGIVAVSRDMLRSAYHARYELLEFAVFTLASRAQELAPLHAGCFGLKGVGILLVGESGAGKSLLALHCMLRGMDLLAEDAVFVAARNLLATGVPNFLHLREDALRFIEERGLRERIRRSPVICRRSGVEKFEIDLRREPYRIARAPLKIAAVIFLTKARAGRRSLLSPVSTASAARRLRHSQPYASGLPSWSSLEDAIARVPAFELRRGAHPAQAAHALRNLIEWGQKANASHGSN